MTQNTTKGASSSTTAAKTGGAGAASSATPWPPAGLQKVATGNVPFFRGQTGDRLWGIKIGSNEALSVPDPKTNVMRHVVYVQLKAPVMVQLKEDGETVERMAQAGDIVNVGVKAQSAPILLQPDGTEIAIEVGKKISIDGGKTMYLMEGYHNAAQRAAQLEGTPSDTTPRLGSGSPGN